MAGNVVYLCGLFRENAFGAARRPRQTRNIKNCSAIYAQSEAERILNVFRQSVQRRGGGVVRNIQKLRGCLYFACGACTISTEYVCAEQESD